MKIGYRQTNASLALLGHTPDIDCGGIPDETQTLCNNARWSDPSWYDGNIPGIDTRRAPRKDTIVVPAGGYAVIRFVADNPGLWFLHCHITYHDVMGMGILLNDSFSRISPPPEGFPECRNFPAPTWLTNVPDEDGVNDALSRCSTDSENSYTKEEFWGMFGALLLVLLIQFCVSI